jgi:hypothetical protein
VQAEHRLPDLGVGRRGRLCHAVVVEQRAALRNEVAPADAERPDVGQDLERRLVERIARARLDVRLAQADKNLPLF